MRDREILDRRCMKNVFPATVQVHKLCSACPFNWLSSNHAGLYELISALYQRDLMPFSGLEFGLGLNRA